MKRIRNLFFIVLLLLLTTNAYSTLYHNDFFDNSIFKTNYGVDYDLSNTCYAVSTVKLIADPQRDNPATAFAVDASYNRMVWNYYDSTPLTGGWMLDIFGGAGVSDGKFLFPKGICANSSGDVYVSDTGNNRIVKLYYDITKPEMRFVKNFGNGVLNNPQQVALDRSGNVYVCDSGNNRIVVFNSNGDYSRTISGGFQNPMGVTVSIADGLPDGSQGSIYVADTGNGRLLKFRNDGTLDREFRRSEEQPLAATYFSMDTDLFGNVYAVDSVNNLVYKFDPNLDYITSTSGRPSDPFNNLHGISCDKSYDANGVWFSSGACYTVENTRGQYFDIGMDVVNVFVSNSPFYPKGFEKTVTEIKYRLTENGEVTINVKDATGTGFIRSLVSNSLESIGNHSHIWDGRDNNGKLVAEGNYQFEIIAHDLYNEGVGNKQVFKYAEVEVILPPSVSINSITPAIVIATTEAAKINYTISRDANVTIKIYRGTEVFDERTITRDLIGGIIKRKIENPQEQVWDILDNTMVNYAKDGEYTIEAYAEDYAGRSEPERSPPIKIDRTPSYVVNQYCEPMIFKPNDGINTTLNYTLSDKAEVRIEIINVAGDVLLGESIGIKEKGSWTYSWDGKINNSLVADGSYVIKVTSYDDVGNKAEASLINTQRNIRKAGIEVQHYFILRYALNKADIC